MNPAILFLVFNRPETTRRVFEAIRTAAPTKLYIAADGPRSNREGEKDLCEQVRKIATAVDWPCEIHTLFRPQNLGCRIAVSTAIDWFFEHEEQGIILEDDCLPDASWFPFAAEMLERYRDNERIMCISASHFHGAAHRPVHSYFFSRYNHCWGWASWRRAWRHYDRNMTAWPSLKATNWLRTIGMGNRLFSSFWTEIFDMAHEGIKVDSWAYRWTFSCWAREGLTVLPAHNLVSNIGFGVDATHTTHGDATSDAAPLERLEFPLQHPERIVRDEWADQWTDRHVFGITAARIVKRRIEAMPIVTALLTWSKSWSSSARQRR